MSAPRPILSVTVAPLSVNDAERLKTALQEIAQTVPPFTKTEQPSGEVVLAGESEMHLQAICTFLRHDRQIDIAITPPQVIYLETILRASEAEGKYIRQTGGKGNYGHVKIRLEPQDSGASFAFINLIHSGVIPEQYFQPIEQGIREAARGGILASHEVVDFKATLYGGSHHETDSNPRAFQIAALLAFKEAAKMADPIVIEPMMTTSFTTMENRLAEALEEINSLRGRVEDMTITRGVAVVRVLVPLREMLGYQRPAAQLMRFSHYALANWPPESDAANASVRKPRGPAPNPRRAAVDPDFDWT